MKYFLLLITLFGVVAYAELPVQLDDIKVRETSEYLDSKVTSVTKNTQAFSSSTSTSTIKGWLDIGLEIVTAGGVDYENTASCPTGKRVISCGVNAASAISQVYPITSTSCKGYAASGQPTVYAICAKVK